MSTSLPTGLASVRQPTFQEYLNEVFNLPPTVILRCDKYYILHWQNQYLHSQLLSGAGRVIREKISYTPIFLSANLQDELLTNPEAQAKLSFRRLKGKIGGIVLISRSPK